MWGVPRPLLILCPGNATFLPAPLAALSLCTAPKPHAARQCRPGAGDWCSRPIKCRFAPQRAMSRRRSSARVNAVRGVGLVGRCPSGRRRFGAAEGNRLPAADKDEGERGRLEVGGQRGELPSNARGGPRPAIRSLQLAERAPQSARGTSSAKPSRTAKRVSSAVLFNCSVARKRSRCW